MLKESECEQKTQQQRTCPYRWRKGSIEIGK